MPERQIRLTVEMAHSFNSAYSAAEVYRLLPVPVSPEDFIDQAGRLVASGAIRNVEGDLYADRASHLVARRSQQRTWSRRFLATHAAALARLTRIPWIEYVGLTGSTCFDACEEGGDLDLFVVTQRHRLWISICLMSAMKRVNAIPRAFCINYVVEEDRLRFPERDYFTAVQLVQMVPLYNSAMKAEILRVNPWVFEFLPNARGAPDLDPSPGSPPRSPGKRESWALRTLNRGLFVLRYRPRLGRLLGAHDTAVISQGCFKAHRCNRSTMYAPFLVDRPAPVARTRLGG